MTDANEQELQGEAIPQETKRSWISARTPERIGMAATATVVTFALVVSYLSL